MKKLVSRIPAFVAILVVATSLYANKGVMAASQNSSDATGVNITLETPDRNMGTISVNGNGIIKVDPDMATVNIGVELVAPTAKEAQDEVAMVMEKIIEALKKAGIDEKDIKTNNYYMYERYDYAQSTYSLETMTVTEPEKPSYAVSHILQVNIYDISIVGEVIEAATEAGANQQQGVNFGLANQEELYIEALAIAVENAGTKAKALAKSVGVEIGMPSYVTEGYSYSNQVYMSGVASYDSSALRVQTGQVEVTASVTITYNYELDKE